MAAVSIALATYNGAHFLDEQLESLARQTLLPAELVVSDDGSTDATMDILRAFAARAPFPVRILPGHDRLGVAENFFRAAEACTAPLIAFCDQDDVWLTEKLALCVERMEQDGSLLAMHIATLTDAHLAPVGLHRQDIAGNSVAPALTRDIGVGCWGNTMLFRGSLLSAADWRHRPTQTWKRAPMLHDSWIYVLACALGPVSLIDEPLCLYRQHDGNLMGTVRKRSLLGRMRGLRYVPLYHYRLAAAFYRDMASIFGTITDPEFSEQAALAARAFQQRARRTEARINCHIAPDIIARARSLCERQDDPLPSSLTSDLLLGVLRLGKVDDRAA